MCINVCVCTCVCVCEQLFLAALSFVYFAKAFAGGYMKSSVTQIERRFDIPSSLIGVIDGSFEIGGPLSSITHSFITHSCIRSLIH